MDELKAKFEFNETENIKATFKIDMTPSKVSQLENDMGFVTKDEVITPDIDLSNLATKDELQQGLETKQPKGNYASPNDIPDISNLATKDELADKADDDVVVHKDGTEVIHGTKTFNSAINFIGSGDSNSVGISENTRFNVYNTNKTILGMGNGLFYINHGDYRLRLRGKDTRPHYNTDTNYLALLSDIPNVTNLATKTELKTEIDKVNETLGNIDSLLDAINGEVV